MNERVAAEDLYISADIEADGPIPGPYSMLSFGLALAGIYDGERFVRLDPAERTFYRELRPICDDFVPEALAVSGLDRVALARDGAEPAAAMTEAADWVREVAGDRRPVLVAWPLAFDWMWLYWYFVRFGRHGSPFGHQRGLDAKTIYALKSRERIDRTTKSDLPAALRSARPHTHNALDDAIEQADLFANLVEWPGRPREDREPLG